jgi:hypothetical protein
MPSSDSKTKDQPKSVFVISPIGKLDEDSNDFAKLCLEQIIKPAAEDCGGYAVPERADEHHKPGSVTAKVVTAILDADVCVADLTGRNPNVMYEVAIAHAADKPVILLQQEQGGPPFDFADERVIHYGLRVDQANAARAELLGHFKSALHEKEDPRLAATMNPVRMLFGQLKASAVASEPEKAVLTELQAVRSELRRINQMQPLQRHPEPSDGSSDVDASLLTLSRLLRRSGALDPEDLRELAERIAFSDDAHKERLLHQLASHWVSPGDADQRTILSRLIRDTPPF